MIQQEESQQGGLLVQLQLLDSIDLRLSATTFGSGPASWVRTNKERIDDDESYSNWAVVSPAGGEVLEVGFGHYRGVDDYRPGHDDDDLRL